MGGAHAAAGGIHWQVAQAWAAGERYQQLAVLHSCRWPQHAHSVNSGQTGCSTCMPAVVHELKAHPPGVGHPM